MPTDQFFYLNLKSTLILLDKGWWLVEVIWTVLLTLLFDMISLLRLHSAWQLDGKGLLGSNINLE